MEFLKRLWNDEEGQGMVEYALIIALVAIIAMVGLVTLGPTIKDKFDEITSQLGGTPNTGQ